MRKNDTCKAGSCSIVSGSALWMQRKRRAATAQAQIQTPMKLLPRLDVSTAAPEELTLPFGSDDSQLTIASILTAPTGKSSF